MFRTDPRKLTSAQLDEQRRWHIHPADLRSRARRVTCKRTGAVAYVYTAAKSGKPAYLLFKGKALKPAGHYVSRDEETRARKVTEFFEGVQQSQAIKKKWTDERNKPHNLQVGHIFYTSWGYEQTNVDWFQIVGFKGKTMAIVREIGALSTEDTGWMQGKCSPKADAFIGDEKTVRIQHGNSFKVGGHYAHLWDGKPKHWSSYH